MLSLLLLTFTLLLAGSAPAVHGWGEMAHLTIAEIANRHVETSTREKLEACARVLRLTGPYPKVSDSIVMSTWSDSIVDMGLRTMITWHRVNTPVNPDKVPLDASFIAINVTSVIPQLINAISNSDGARVAETVVPSVANLVHFVGDCHQPLHAASLYNEALPNGDLGGDTIDVVVDEAKNTVVKLHDFWDFMAQGPFEAVRLPLSIADQLAISELADEIEQNNNFTDFELRVKDVPTMAKESYTAATQFAYTADVMEASKSGAPAVLTEEYKTNARTVALRRVGLAGFRLATMLNDALKNVRLELIQEGEANVEARIKLENEALYGKKPSGLRDGEVAAIVLACFVIGCLLGVAAMITGYMSYRRKVQHNQAHHAQQQNNSKMMSKGVHDDDEEEE